MNYLTDLAKAIVEVGEGTGALLTFAIMVWAGDRLLVRRRRIERARRINADRRVWIDSYIRDCRRAGELRALVAVPDELNLGIDSDELMEQERDFWKIRRRSL